MSAYRTLVRFSSLLLVVLGVAMLAYTAARGGGVGILIGLLFVAAGAGRLYLMRSRR